MNCQQLQPHVSEAEILKPGISFRTVFMAEVGAPSYDRDFDITLNGLVEALPQRATIAEYGAGANPHLESHRRILKGDVSYLRIDVSAHELAKSSAPGESVRQSPAGWWGLRV